MKRKATTTSFKKKKPPIKRSRLAYATRQRDARTSIPRFIPKICAPQQLVKLVYNEGITTAVTLSTQSYNANTYYINDIYDFSTGSASEALAGYGAWSSLYNRWRVKSAKVKLTMFNTTNLVAIYGGIVFSRPGQTFSTDFTTWAAMINAMENPNCWSTMLATIGTTGAMKDIEFAVNPKNLIGDPRQYEADISYTGVVSTSPVLRIPMYLFIATQNGASQTVNVNVKLNVEFCIEFYERKINQN